MHDAIRFALLGFGIGALYTLGAQGLIVIYRGSGVVNFALGAMGMAGAYCQWELQTKDGWPFVAAAIAGIALSALLGACTQLMIMRPLRHASSLARVVATLGVLATIQSLAVLRYGTIATVVRSELPTNILRIHGSILITADRLILIGIAGLFTLVLWALYRYTKFGLATAAVAENRRAASALGWSPERIAVQNWALGAALAAFAAILITPIITLQVSALTNVILAATAAALLASFASFPLALIGGLGIGVLQSEAYRFVAQPGVANAVPFVIIVALLMLRGTSLPLRDYFLARLPSVGSGRIRWNWAILGLGAGCALLVLSSSAWIAAVTISLATALILLSLVVLTGYTGQISLAQFAIAGFGAWVAGRLVAAEGLPFPVAAIIGVSAAVPLGILFALPAVRTRGINLAIVTLGLGTAIELVLFQNPAYTGGLAGTVVGDPKIFGLDVNAISHPTRYGVMTLACFAVAAIVVSNIRRGRTGRRLLAARANERAAAALGISVAGAKLYAFAVSAGIAALGGVLYAFQQGVIDYPSFTNFTSILFVGFAMIGGIGYLMGSIIGGLLAEGGLNQQILGELFPGVGRYVNLIGGASIILLVLLNQNGVAKETIAQVRWLTRKLALLIPALRERPARRIELTDSDVVRVASRVLTVREMTVRYGATTAVDRVSLTLRPGQIVGLIGPNGAGKTSLIDAITGFTRAAAGGLSLDGTSIDKLSATQRSRLGLGRSFQSLELFEDASVLENLRVAADPRDSFSYLRDLIWPRTPPLPEAVLTAIREFRLENDLDTLVEDLPYGKRRLLAIARTVAAEPSVVLLDEPVAGLDDAETAEVAALVRRLASQWGMSVLVVEHDMSFVMSVCDEIVVLDFGRTISEGPPHRVRRDPTVVAAYLGVEEPGEALVAAGRKEAG